MPHYKIICRLIRDRMLKKDPYGFQSYNLCNCKLPFCNSKFKDNENIQNSDSLGTINYEVIQHQMIHASL